MSHKKFRPDRFSRFDVYWIQTNKQTDKQTDRQAKFIYRLGKGVFQKIQSISPLLTYTWNISFNIRWNKTTLSRFCWCCWEDFWGEGWRETETKKGDGTVVMKRKYVPTLARGSEIKGKYVPTLAMGSKMKGKLQI